MDRRLLLAQRRSPAVEGYALRLGVYGAQELHLWESCTLQTLFSVTGNRRYFRVVHPAANPENNVEGSSCSEVSADEEERRQQATQFMQQLRSQREKHNSIAKAAQNVNPDPTQKGAGVELWMKKLGNDRFIAGIYKDEMTTSYKPLESEDSQALQDLREVSNRMLRRDMAAVPVRATTAPD